VDDDQQRPGGLPGLDDEVISFGLHVEGNGSERGRRKEGRRKKRISLCEEEKVVGAKLSGEKVSARKKGEGITRHHELTPNYYTL